MLTVIWSPPILLGASEKGTFFSATDLNRNFSLKLSDVTIHPVAFFSESLTGKTVKRTLSDTYSFGLPEEGVQKSKR
ncbi:MAG: hypothetical protein KAS65_02985, partial [Candidatus Aminicenantes bacterium]|nr:hypothetical protein [Candidatus Aminicenantes bacterium]